MVSHASKNLHILLSLTWSVAIILFLFFIDEGYYNFNWMKEPGNWIAFVLYLTGFSCGQWITHSLFLRNYSGKYKTTLVNLIGIPFGFVLIILLFAIAGHL